MQSTADRLTHLVNEFDKRVQAAPAGSWGNASPCEGWTARDVVAHLSNNFNGIAQADAVTDDEDIVAAWGAAKARMAHLLTTDLSNNVDGPFGPMPLEQMLGRFVATDVLVHTFDLARAVGGDEHLDQDAVAQAYSGIKPMGDAIRRPGAFGAATPCPEDAGLQTEFLCHIGRPV